MPSTTTEHCDTIEDSVFLTVPENSVRGITQTSEKARRLPADMRISVPTATAGKTDLAVMAKGAGIEHSVILQELKNFQSEAADALNESGLRFIGCKIEESLKHRQLTRSNVDLLETKYRFVRYLERTEGKPIFIYWSGIIASEIGFEPLGSRWTCVNTNGIGRSMYAVQFAH